MVKAETKMNLDDFTEDYMNYYPLVFSTIYSKVNNKDEADDICQEVFIAFHNKYNEIENKRKWLYGCIRIQVLRHYDKKSNKNDDIDDNLNDVSLTFVNGFRDTRILIQEAIDGIKCTEEEKMVIDLIATHNFTYQYVADLYGLTRRQVEYKYSQLVKRVIDYLEKKGITNIEDLL